MIGSFVLKQTVMVELKDKRKGGNSGVSNLIPKFKINNNGSNQIVPAPVADYNMPDNPRQEAINANTVIDLTSGKLLVPNANDNLEPYLDSREDYK